MLGRCVAALFVGLVAVAASNPACAEVTTVRIAHQPGLSYLPLMIMEKDGLLQKHAHQHGLATLTYESVLVGNAAALNDVLLAGATDVVAGAITVMAVIAERARSLGIRGIAALNLDNHYLNTNKPRIKTLRDFSDRDRIAVSAVKLSIHAIVLQMAAEKEFGLGHHEALDRLTVSLPHPEAMASLLAAGTEITAHLTTTPFKKAELKDSRIHRVLSTDTLLGGSPTGAMLWTTARFREENPKAYAALLSALKEAVEIIRTDPEHAARTYLEMEKSKLETTYVRELVTDAEDPFTIVPQRTFAFIEFMQRTGRLNKRFSSWKDMFFPEIYDQPGS
jgi:NitT/TauT family transport system substrate-binding protein